MVGLECTDRKPIGHRGLMHSVWCINNIQYLHLMYSICYVYCCKYICINIYLYIYIYIYIYERETSVCMCYTITVKQKTQRLFDEFSYSFNIMYLNKYIVV